MVIGDVLLDVYIDGTVSRISPEAPIPVVLERGRREVLGGAANVAATIAAFGASVVLAGRVGADAEASRVRELATDLGIDLEGVVTDPAVPTITKTRITSGYQQIVRLDRERLDPLISPLESQLLDAIERFLVHPEGAAIVVSDYGKGTLNDELLRVIIDRAAIRGVPVVCDPKSADLSRYSGSAIIKPNRGEGRAALAPELRAATYDDPEAEFAAICSAVLDVSQAHAVVLSVADHGVALQQRDDAAPTRFPTRALEVADVSGAGDTMTAFLAMGAAAGLDLASNVRIANTAAGLVCAKFGTATLSAIELIRSLEREVDRAASTKIAHDVAALARTLAQNRADGHRVVFTNGCFDILHAGHVHLLQAARRLGDTLVVAVNSDASVSRLKGPTRPVQTEADRLTVLAGLESVDHVIAFEEDTPREVILALMPDVIVKGGDYRPEDVVGGAEARQWGGEVAIVPLVAGRSTTGILARSAPPARPRV